MDTYVYVDGFNLYYGAVRKTPYKWLDIPALCRAMLPTNNILKVKYFTAKVSARPNDPRQSTRQQTYLRALASAGVEIYFGHFLTHLAWMPLHTPNPADQVHANASTIYVRVLKTEEKGSDVNIAAQLLMDGFNKNYKAAVVISNDSDLCMPIRMVRQNLELVVGILNPNLKNPSVSLKKDAAFVKPIRTGALAGNQFPPVLADAAGTITKPPEW